MIINKLKSTRDSRCRNYEKEKVHYCKFKYKRDLRVNSFE